MSRSGTAEKTGRCSRGGALIACRGTDTDLLRRRPLMPLYHLLLDGTTFHDRIRPALAAAWKGRSFEPCRGLCADLIPAAERFARRYHLGGDEPLLRQVAAGLPFDRDFWRHLVGELLWFGASEIPEFE